jgi:G3E family GTPase
VVDAAAPLDDALLRAQVRAADIVAISKLDRAGDAGRVRAAVAAIKPAAVVVEAVQGAVPAELLFMTGLDPQPREIGRRGPVADRFVTTNWTSDHPMSLPRFQAAIECLSPRLARAKGVFETVERPGRPMLLQLAGGRAMLSPGPAGLPIVRLVFISEIGRLSEDEIHSTMAACLPDPSLRSGGGGA